MRHRRLPVLLLISYVILFIVLGIQPLDRAVWWAENIPVLIIVGCLVAMYSRLQFSATAYVMMSVFIFLHTIGGHYTFEHVPFDWVTNAFGFERNHYDRIAHFSVGFYAYAIAELVERKNLSRSRLLTCSFAVAAIFTVASVYEIIEWLYAANAAPEAGTAFLGSQGDIWDAQKDMLADGLGGIMASVFYHYHSDKTAMATALK